MKTVFFLTTLPCILSLGLKNRIAHGSLTEIGNFPFHVQIVSWDSKTDKTNRFCSGSIISQKIILTAAHCIIGNLGATVFVGSDRKIQGEMFQSEKLISHPDFKSLTRNDVGLVFLNRSIEFSPTKNRIPLADENFQVSPKDVVFVTGFGRTEFSDTSSNELRGKKILVLPENLCRVKLHQSQFCASSGPCKGDSGGPVVINGTQVGLVSGGYMCREKTGIILLTKISAVRKWIDDTIVSSIRKKKI